MKANHLKILAIAIFSGVFFAALLFASNTATSVKAEGDVAAEYKAKCAMCHSPKAEKAFDPTKAVDALTQIILKGKSDAKPPMPGYEAKGMTADHAKALAEYMVSLRKPADAPAANTAANANADANANCPDTTKPPAKFDEATAATYKTKCAMCHSPKAEKAFDPTKADDVLTQIVLKGKTDAKPPMPGYEAKGMKAEEAAALVGYMKALRK